MDDEMGLSEFKYCWFHRSIRIVRPAMDIDHSVIRDSWIRLKGLDETIVFILSDFQLYGYLAGQIVNFYKMEI